MSASVSICQGDVRNNPIEAVELTTPVRVVQRTVGAETADQSDWLLACGGLDRSVLKSSSLVQH
jgi:hypothetical protein